MPNSLGCVASDTPWTAHPGAPVSVLGTDDLGDSYLIFTDTRFGESRPRAALSWVLLLLAITALQRVMHFATTEVVVPLPRCVKGKTGPRSVLEY